MHIVMLTRRVDQTDWLAGFAHNWIAALARHPRVDMLDVICLSKGVYNLPDNVSVWSMGKERGKNRLREFVNFNRALRHIIRGTDLIFGHMIPRYILVAAPWALLYGVPMVQWYTHRSVHFELRLSHAMVKRVVTAAPESFRIESPKKVVIGHGIDMDLFSPGENVEPPDERLVISVGRLSPVKNLHHLVNGFAQLAQRPNMQDVRLELVGGPTPAHPEYPATLQTLIDDASLSGRVSLVGPLPQEALPDLYRQAAAFVSLSETGGIDKAVLESMACGLPPLVSGEVYLPLLGDDAQMLLIPSTQREDVSDRLAQLLALPAEERHTLGQRLRARVREDYALETLIDRLVNVFEICIGGTA